VELSALSLVSVESQWWQIELLKFHCSYSLKRQHGEEEVQRGASKQIKANICRCGGVAEETHHLCDEWRGGRRLLSLALSPLLSLPTLTLSLSAF